MLLGIDVGGTHTDAVLVGKEGLVASAKIPTDHENLLRSVKAALETIVAKAGPEDVERLNLSTTLSTNAIVEGKTDPAGVFVSAGPGIDPANYAMGEYYFTASGSIDHRGAEIEPLDEKAITQGLEICREAGVKAFAAVTKFSTRNPAHERRIKELVHTQAEYVAMGHEFSGQPGFGRRIATAYYNCAVWRTYNRFADAVQQSALALGLSAGVNILKADGGTIPLALSRSQPVQSILSGPAASVMGIIAVCDIKTDSVILDVGGTTTDIAVFAEGAPLIENEGIAIAGRPTLVRALRTRSIGVGGDSAVGVSAQGVMVGPQRFGPSMALGGAHPTLVDALNVLGAVSYGDPAASLRGMAELAGAHGYDPETLAEYAVSFAINRIREETADFIREINDKPVYTIYEMLEGKKLVPARVYAMGGPAMALAPLLRDAFSEEVVVPEHYAVANAIGAALSRPTFSVELFADTSKGRMLIPSLGESRETPRDYNLSAAENDARAALRNHLRQQGMFEGEADIEVTEGSSFNMVEGMTMTGQNIRVACQIRPGVLPGYRKAVSCKC